MTNLEEAFRYAEGCDGIGNAIPNAIRSVKDKIERLERFKTNFSNYIEDIKEFDFHFAFDVSNNCILEAMRNNISTVNINVQDIAELEKLVEKEKFYNMMDKCYGFTPEESRLILKAYDLSVANKDYLTVDEITLQAQLQAGNPFFKCELTKEDKIKDFLTNMSALGGYTGLNWSWTADAPTTREAKDYLKGIGMSDEEVNTLQETIINQHNDKNLDKSGRKDFSHEIVELAAYLNEYGSMGRMVVDAGTFGQTDELSTFKGDIWSGAMGNADLLSDIDSINIYSRMNEDKDSDFMDIFTNYNISVIDGKTNRADEFCKVYGNGDMEKGQDRIKDIVESWSPGAEYLTEKHKITIPYILNELKEGLALNAYMNSDPGLKYTKDEVDKVVDDMKQNTTDYNIKTKEKNQKIEDAKVNLYNFLGIEYNKE